MSEGTPAVEVRGLRREYERKGRGALVPWRRRQRDEAPVIALDGVDLSIGQGEIHGMLGPNGAGKTTLCKILSTVLLPTAGSARLLGYDVVDDLHAVRRRVGIVFGGERGLYARLTARQNLEYWGALHRLGTAEARQRAERLLDRMGLDERADAPVETFSRGMKQRLHLARGVIGDPPVILLDEPTTGLDPVAAHEFRDLVRELRDEGRTILLTTHDMAEAETVCDRVSMIDRGRLIATEPPRTLAKLISKYDRVDVGDADSELLDRLAELPGVESVERLEDGAARVSTNEEGASAEVLRRLVAAGATQVQTSSPTLEEVYLRVIGNRGLRI